MSHMCVCVWCSACVVSWVFARNYFDDVLHDILTSPAALLKPLVCEQISCEEFVRVTNYSKCNSRPC